MFKTLISRNQALHIRFFFCINYHLKNLILNTALSTFILCVGVWPLSADHKLMVNNEVPTWQMWWPRDHILGTCTCLTPETCQCECQNRDNAQTNMNNEWKLTCEIFYFAKAFVFTTFFLPARTSMVWAATELFIMWQLTTDLANKLIGFLD